MPNIKIMGEVDLPQLSLCLSSISDQIFAQNGVRLVWQFIDENGNTRIHYTWQVLQDKVIQDGQQKLKRLPVKMYAGAHGVQLISNGDMKRAIKKDMKGRGFNIEYKGWI
jgi:hypothetical protein